MKELALRVRHLSKKYRVGETEILVLRGLSFSVEVGELVAVVGQSGSGKSTLLHCLGALESPSSGECVVGGHRLSGTTDREVSRFRNRHVGFVFQNHNLLAEFTALENVCLPGIIAGESMGRVRGRAQALLERVGLRRRMSHYPGQLSGGEQQRVAIARALVNQPLLVLADEPSGNLDSVSSANVHSLLAEVNSSLGTTILIVTHNGQFAASLPRCLELRDGRLVGDLRRGGS